METKHALIIGICIIIGFAIDPLTRDTSSEPNDRWILVKYPNGQGTEPFLAKEGEWRISNGVWRLGVSNISVADIKSAMILEKLYKK